MNALSQVEIEVKRLLCVSGYRGILFVGYYIRPFVQEARQAGFTPEQIQNTIEETIDQFIADHNLEGWMS